MSKLLKAVATKHRPHIAAKMEPANGYDETKHHFPRDLVKAKVVTKPEGLDLEGCLGDLDDTGSHAAAALKAAQSGKINKDTLNDDAFVKALMAMDDDGAPDDLDEDDNADGDDQPIDEDVKETV